MRKSSRPIRVLAAEVWLAGAAAAQRYLFGLRGSALIAGAVGGGCTRCTAPELETLLADLMP